LAVNQRVKEVMATAEDPGIVAEVALKLPAPRIRPDGCRDTKGPAARGCGGVMSTPDIAVQERAAGVAQANAALKRSLDLLANESDLEGFFGRVLCEIGVCLDARYILMWLMDGKPGNVVPKLAWSEASGPGNADDVLPAEVTGAILVSAELLHSNEGPTLHSAKNRAASEQERENPLVAHAIGALLHLPLLIGEEFLGGITVLLTETEQPTVVEIGRARALAHQATLTLRLEWLSAKREAAALLKERARIAREIHDGIGQAFIGIHRHLRSAFAPDFSLAIAKAIELAKDGLAETRRTVKALGPRQLSNMSFLDAVQDVAGKVIPQKIRFLLSTTGTWPALTPEKESNLFRVIQEAFSNIARHSFATQLNLDVSVTPQELSILIQDNGRGFAPHDKTTGVGLTCMRQRIEAIEGFLRVASTPGSGTQVFIRLACA
jgi:two-component system, NarL family, sensor kinase